jgi:hypothetical protein
VRHEGSILTSIAPVRDCANGRIYFVGAALNGIARGDLLFGPGNPVLNGSVAGFGATAFRRTAFESVSSIDALMDFSDVRAHLVPFLQWDRSAIEAVGAPNVEDCRVGASEQNPRMVWALITKGGSYREPVVQAA